MNNMPRLSKSGIEYLDCAWNFYSGCLNWKNGVCPVEKCWAKGITERFPDNYPNGFEPTFYPEAFLSPLHLKKPSRIGVAFMGDLFGDWVNPEKKFVLPERREGWIDLVALRSIVFQVIKACPQHKFLFKTKCPWNLEKWSPFPDCWVGVTATNWEMFYEAKKQLARVNAKIKYLSLEPLLNWYKRKEFYAVNALKEADINWVIIGSQTKPYKPPKIEWIREIVRACDKAGVPVFLKDNLGWPRITADGSVPFYKRDKTGTWILRQEMPE